MPRGRAGSRDAAWVNPHRKDHCHPEIVETWTVQARFTCMGDIDTEATQENLRAFWTRLGIAVGQSRILGIRAAGEGVARDSMIL